MHITKIDRTSLKSLRKELDKVLAEFGTKTNLTLSVGNISFASDGTNATLKVKAQVKGSMSPEVAALKKHADFYGISLNDATYLGDTVRLVGFNPRARKNMFHFIFVTGERKGHKGFYVADEKFARQVFGKVPA